MPITKEKNGKSINGEKYSQLKTLHEKIGKGEPIEEFIRCINPEYLLDIVNFPVSYITRDLSNSDELTAVHLAAKKGNLDALKTLSSLNADFSATTKSYGKNPLHLAAEYDHADIIDYLVEVKKIPVDIPTQATSYYRGEDCSPLFECAVHSCFNPAERLIHHKANINFKDLNGAIPLHYSCEYGFGKNSDEVVFKFIKMLISNGADPAIKGKIFIHDNTTALEHLSEERQEKIKKLVDSVLQEKKLPAVSIKVSEFSQFTLFDNQNEDSKDELKEKKQKTNNGSATSIDPPSYEEATSSSNLSNSL